ncbi:MAG TPA: choice-of-anchor Q domain-containing protein, partial [Pseudomonadales bacterium]|nr:choice-of-anchor Q domain-containing protein [Pseudomonadales bacterium]
GDGAANRVIVSQPLTLQSVNGPAFTSIDGGGVSRCVYLTNNAVLNGFTLTNGSVTGYPLGGAGVCGASNSMVENCLITKSTANNGGACFGILSNCTITAGSGYGTVSNILFNCTISNNGFGGGEYDTFYNCLIISNALGGASQSTLYNCIISNNAAEGGLYGCKATGCLIISNQATFENMSGATSSSLTNCLLIGNNTTANGGGAYISTLVNCTIVNNSAAYYGGGVYGGTLKNCILYYNKSTNYPANNNYFIPLAMVYCSTFPLPSIGFGNFTNTPLFIDTNNNFHLQSTSPCINSGNNAFISATTDLDGSPRIQGGTVDVGAYEYQTPTSVISYAYLQKYGLPTDGSVDYANLDGSGFNVYQKWVAGLNPTNSASVLVMLPVTTTNTVSGITITWQSVSGINYNLQSTTNILVPFSTIQSNIIGNAGTTSFIDTSATNGTPYFYRVGVQAP